MHDDQLTEAAEKYYLQRAAELLGEAGFVETASGEWVPAGPASTFKVVYTEREAPKV